MRSSFIPALSLLLSSCAVVTTSGTEEAVYFSDKESGNGQAHAVLKPHNDLPMTIEFSCPDNLATAMTSVWVPFPPVLPVGFVNEKLSYLRITVPQDASYANAQIRVTTQQGQPVPMLAEPQSRRVGKDSGEAQLTYVLKQDCETLDGGLLEVAGFSYKNRNYPAIGSRLHFDSRLKLRIGPGIA